jgi:EAL domain-containing protein (putative c-di-GMP-specific phosphodiesterase class I)
VQAAENAILNARRSQQRVVVADQVDEPDQSRDRHQGRPARGDRGGSAVLKFQPELDLGSGRLAGMEALVRWRHSDHGSLPIERVLPVAEQTA